MCSRTVRVGRSADLACLEAARLDGGSDVTKWSFGNVATFPFNRCGCLHGNAARARAATFSSVTQTVKTKVTFMPFNSVTGGSMHGSSNRLTVARFQSRSEALGPGARAIIWFHGCAFDCPGCIASEMNRSSAFERFNPRQLADRVLGITGIEGLTLSGGDPFDQPPDSLGAFLEIIRSRSNLSVMSYTGRTLTHLEQSQRWQRVLSYLDILIDGLYVEALNNGSMWRGSSNQQIHFLSDRYRAEQSDVTATRDRRVEVRLTADRQLEITGIPPIGFMDRLREHLLSHGLQLDLGVPTETTATERADTGRKHTTSPQKEQELAR